MTRGSDTEISESVIKDTFPKREDHDLTCKSYHPSLRKVRELREHVWRGDRESSTDKELDRSVIFAGIRVTKDKERASRV